MWVLKYVNHTKEVQNSVLSAFTAALKTDICYGLHDPNVSQRCSKCSNNVYNKPQHETDANMRRTENICITMASIKTSMRDYIETYEAKSGSRIPHVLT